MPDPSDSDRNEPDASDGLPPATLAVLGPGAARAAGAAVDEAAVVVLLDGVPEQMESSMQRDAAAGRPLELEAIGGAVLRAAEAAGLAAPVTARLVGDLRDREYSTR